MITLQLTEAEAARIVYALQIDADMNNRVYWLEKANGNLSAASGRAEAIYENNRNEALGIIRKIEEQEG